MYRASVFVLLAIFFTSNGAPTDENHSNLVDPHVIGGVDIDIEKAPFQISIELFRWHICGGAIVSDKWVITVAQCIQSALWAKRIRAGSTTSIPLVGWGGSTHQIREAFSHPRYNVREVDYDIGVIGVVNEFDWGPRVQPAPLPAIQESEDSFIAYDKNATITGWGLTQDRSWFKPWNLKCVDIVLMPRIYCAERFQQQGVQVQVTSRVICGAGDGRGGPCRGDNGGPLLHKGKLIGLFSWLKGKCNDTKLPAGFTNLLNEEIRSFVKTWTGV